MAFLENPLTDKNLQAKLNFLKDKTTENTPKAEEGIAVPKAPKSRFDEVYLNHKEDIVAFTKKNFALNEQEVEDAVQEAFIKLLTNIDNVTPGKEPAWLKKTTANILKRYYAIHANRLRILAESFIPEQKRASRQTTAVDNMITQEQELLEMQKLKKGIELLPPRLKEAMSLFVYEGLNSDEIAERLGIGASSARANLSRAIEKLREAFH